MKGYFPSVVNSGDPLGTLGVYNRKAKKLAAIKPGSQEVTDDWKFSKFRSIPNGRLVKVVFEVKSMFKAECKT
jgi:hypothetical protein